MGDHELRVGVLTGDGRTIHRTQRFTASVGPVDLFPLWRTQPGHEVAVAVGFEAEPAESDPVTVLSAQVVQRLETPAGGLSRALAMGWGALDAQINGDLGKDGCRPGSRPASKRSLICISVTPAWKATYPAHPWAAITCSLETE